MAGPSLRANTFTPRADDGDLSGGFNLPLSLWMKSYGVTNNNNELNLHDHTNTYSTAKAMFRNQNYDIGQLRYFDNNLSRTSKQAEIYFMNCILIK